MNPIHDTFAALKQRDELALLAYLTAGFPTLETSLDHVQTAAQHADIIEIGIPFSDPIADGPTIQYASQVALDQGATLRKILPALRERKIDRPLVFMSYLNPLLAYGRERLLAELPPAGVHGLIIPDLPVEEADEWVAATRAANVSLVFLAAPTSDEARLENIARKSDGFVYAVSVTGITGARATMNDALPDYLGQLRRMCRQPVCVGFGISQPTHIQRLRGMADGAIVGSRLIDAIRQQEDLSSLLKALKHATRSSSHAHRHEG